MDPEVLQMMADLGLGRRDLLSAADTDAKARENVRAQEAIRESAETHRAQLRAVSGQDVKDARLRAWNNEVTFDSDEITGQLKNYYSGQGHRAALKQSLQNVHHHDNEETFHPRLGEERGAYLQSKAGKNVNYVPDGPRNRNQNRFRDQILGGAAATPRSLPSRSNFSEHARAPDPRQSGTTRFVKGVRVEKDACGTRVVRENAVAKSIPTQPQPISRLAYTNGIKAAAALRAAPANGAPMRGLLPEPRTDSGDSKVAHSAGQAYVSRTGASLQESIWAHSPEKKRSKAIKPMSDAENIAPMQSLQATASLSKPWPAPHAKEAEAINEYSSSMKVVNGSSSGSMGGTIAEKPVIPPIQSMEPAQVSHVKVNVAGHPHSSSPNMTNSSTSAGGGDTGAKDAVTSSASSAPVVNGCGSGSKGKTGMKKAAASSMPSKRGTLSVTFLDFGGTQRKRIEFSVPAPVMVTTYITSRDPNFDPIGLIQWIESTAKGMMARTQGEYKTHNADKTHGAGKTHGVEKSQGLAGATLADDGLWVDEEL